MSERQNLSAEKPRLRKREIAVAVAIGLFVAGGTAIVLQETDGYGQGGGREVATDKASEMTYDLGPFDEVSTTGPQDVEITYGEAISVRAEGSPQALGQLEAIVENGRITIQPIEGRFSGNWGALQSATFYITMPRLDRIALAGSGDIRVDRIEGEIFEGTVGGSGEIIIDQMDVEEAIFGVFGSGRLVAAGTADETRVTIGGSGEVKASEFRSTEATVSVGGSGDVALTVEGEAIVSVTGSGNVDISGPAECSVTQLGSGDVTCSGPANDDEDEDDENGEDEDEISATGELED